MKLQDLHPGVGHLIEMAFSKTNKEIGKNQEGNGQKEMPIFRGALKSIVDQGKAKHLIV